MTGPYLSSRCIAGRHGSSCTDCYDDCSCSCHQLAGGAPPGTNTLTVWLPLRTVSEANAREHWAKKARRVKSHRGTTALVMCAHLAIVRIRPPCIVTLTRCAPRRLDSDNAVGSLKACRDAVADALGVNDGDEAAVTWAYEQRRGPMGVEIRIEART